MQNNKEKICPAQTDKDIIVLIKFDRRRSIVNLLQAGVAIPSEYLILQIPNFPLRPYMCLYHYSSSFIMIKYIKFHVDSRAKLLRTDKIYPSPVHDTLFRSSSLYVPYFLVLEAFFLEILKRLSQSLFVQIFKYMVI